jgi:hypothetical protein
LSEAAPDLTGLVRALIEAEKAKSTALYAHLSAPKDGSLETLVSAAADYFEACLAVDSALQDMG